MSGIQQILMRTSYNAEYKLRYSIRVLLVIELINMGVDFLSKLDAFAIKKVTDALGEDDLRRQQTIHMVREWLRKQPHLSHCEIGANS